MRLPKQFPGVTFSFVPADIVTQILNFGLPAPIDIQVVGRDLDGNRALRGRARHQAREGAGDRGPAHPAGRSTSRRLHLDVDRTRAGQVGLTERDVANNLLISLSGSSQTAPTFWLNPTTGVSYSVATQTPQYSMDSLQELGNIPVDRNGAAASRRCSKGSPPSPAATSMQRRVAL